jgi:hypothetical protein
MLHPYKATTNPSRSSLTGLAARKVRLRSWSCNRQVLRVAPLHPLLTWRPTALGVLMDLLQVALCLLQVASKPITIPQIDLRVANNLRVADGVRRLSPSRL